ncbi:vanadium-dependent haloperoxidase [Mucilaginibacter sp. 21P]|uniref:vanadium-dependent haloperoxidase n=1 Tax=Mucilaginibacter sp. 21P TaxID=2778902 RepID=UPI001C597B2F|nr:vanadium-dependent haloperoxidase [Mucilaginibacter sp. 21P]QXV65642.1 vanadium-dependent haloperoxidase [Mucilaginibacter sp. 21P]
MRGIKQYLFIAAAFISGAVSAQSSKTYPDYLQPDHAVNALTMVMIHDVVSPPVAARYYAYSMMGAYNLVEANTKSVPTLKSIVKAYQPTGVLDTLKGKYDYKIASYYAILEIGKQLLPSGALLEDDQTQFVTLLKKTGVKQDVIDNSIKAALAASKDVLAFSKSDNYNKLSALKRYTPSKADGKWYPTPPGYFEAVEPNWRTIRVMLLDSARQCKAAKLVPFNKDTTSAFYKQVMEVYNQSKHLSVEQINQAMFWDCNPFAITTSGHMAIGFKKISPGGHWMHLTGQVAKQAKLSFDQTVAALTVEGATLMDAFISCWDEKYNSDRIRPETFINRYIDVKWQPVLQTPPFPEFTSGHAVVSNASAELLTYLLGDNFSFTDNTEVPFGSSQRSFKSFRQAAAEASMSRFYGGIHYMESVTQGNVQGKEVGNIVISKLKAAGLEPFAK